MITKFKFSCLSASALVLFFTLTSYPIIAFAKGKITPTTNNGKKWRIGFYQGGPWRDYQETLMVTVDGLAEIGWLVKSDYPELPDRNDTKLLWSWLAHNIQSDFIEFVENAYWSAGWEDDLRDRNVEACLDRLRKKDIDLIFALGTWAGLDLANNRHSVPTIVMSTTEPVRSGIIKSAEDSGFDHVMARTDPTRYLRQIRLFHNIIRFKRLGVVYDDTSDGKIYANLFELNKVSNERKFKLIHCVAPDTDLARAEAVQRYADCVAKIAPQVDAFYFAGHRGSSTENLSQSLKILLAHKIPTWSNWGMLHVKKGVLLSVGREDLKFTGRFYAEQCARIFNGVIPRDLNQILKEKLNFSINLHTANTIGYRVPRNVLKVADVVFEKIE